jgi:glutamate formiminotransferase
LSALVEIVPNISEGRNVAVIDACVAAIESAGARVIDRSSDAVHNRSVITAVGTPEAVAAASLALALAVVERIDLRHHSGIHPRIGALDVLPFVPLRDVTLADCAALARVAGARIWERCAIPAYYYEAAAGAPQRADLAQIRAHAGTWPPDVGGAPHERAGYVAIGARPILVAFNVELASGDLALAKAIAARLRERGGGLRTLKALGLRLDAERVQVSFNITDYQATPLHRVVELVRALAAERGVAVLRSELIGLAPLDAVREAARYYGAAAATMR